MALDMPFALPRSISSALAARIVSWEESRASAMARSHWSLTAAGVLARMAEAAFALFPISISVVFMVSSSVIFSVSAIVEMKFY